MNRITGITEDDIANYLANTPGFFERHAELLAAVELANPHGQRAVSLQQRQMEMLRERIRGLERRIMDMIRHGQENAGVADRLHEWTCAMMLVDEPADLPPLLLQDLQGQFQIPQAALRLWDVDTTFADLPFAAPVDAQLRQFAADLTQPYCGANAAFGCVEWLTEPQSVSSLALIPLRLSAAGAAFGLLVLASPDPTRYSADMGTDFLVRLGELASAALSRLLPE